MFERYTEPARRVIFFARYEAEQFGSAKIETHHLLLGLLRQDLGLLHTFLSKEQTSSIRGEIEAKFPPQGGKGFSKNLPLSMDSKQAVAGAAQEADVQRHGSIDPEHLLAGLLREKGSFGASLLLERGVTLEAVREFTQKSQRPKVLKQGELRLINGLRFFSFAALVLFAFQVAGKLYALGLQSGDVHFYGVALPAAYCGHLLLLWLARRNRMIPRSRYVHYLWIATVLFLLPLALMGNSFFTQHSSQP